VRVLTGCGAESGKICSGNWPEMGDRPAPG
jgi:hypothetical protein